MDETQTLVDDSVFPLHFKYRLETDIILSRPSLVETTDNVYERMVGIFYQ